MRAFKFSLASVQTLRQRQEQIALEAYARALLERSRILDQLHQAEHELAQQQAEWQRHSAVGCAAGTIARYAAHCQGLARRRDESTRALGEAERLVQARLQEVLSARQRLQAVNRLETRRRRAYLQAAERSEQKFIDDLAQRRAGVERSFHPAEMPANSL